MKKIILASQSPWRKKLLTWMGVDFKVVVSDFDENSIHQDDPKELVGVLAEKKAEAVTGDITKGVVIGADTVIVYGDEVIGKPKNIDDARKTLNKLRGKTHFVYTGVCVMDVSKGVKVVEVDETKMVFKDFSDVVLENYLDTGDSMGKAGSYQFLKIKEIFLQSFDGSVSGVIGLPVKRLAKMLAGVGVKIDSDISSVMLDKIGYAD